MIRRKILPAAIAVVLGLAATAAATAQEVVRLGNLKFAHYGAVSYMKEIAPKYGLKIEENFFAKGADIYPAMAAGAVDIAASAADGAIAARGNGVALFTVAGFSNGGARLLAGPNTGIKTLADVKGRKAATARGGAHELLLMASLEKAGLTWSDKPGKDVQILYLGYNDLNQAVSSGLVDVVCQSEPQAAVAVARGLAIDIGKPYDTPVGVPVRVLVMTEAMYKDKPETAAKVLRVFVEATNAFIRDEALAEKYVREQIFRGTLSEEEFKGAMENADFVTDIDPAQMQVTTDLMVKYGLGKMANPPQAEQWVKLDLLKAAKSEAKTQ